MGQGPILLKNAFLLSMAMLTKGLAAEGLPAPVPSGIQATATPLNRAGSAVTHNGDRLLVGDLITVTKSGHSISFPAWVNQREGVIEYAIVMRSGKTHESLFATDADAKDLHVAALLLGVKPEDILRKPNETWTVTAESAVEVQVDWKVGEKVERHVLSDLVVLREPKGTKPDEKFQASRFVYNGSRVIEGGAFLAQTGGSIVTMIFDPDALINNPQVDRNDDDIHAINTALVPPTGTPVTITLQLVGRARSDGASSVDVGKGALGVQPKAAPDLKTKQTP